MARFCPTDTQRVRGGGENQGFTLLHAQLNALTAGCQDCVAMGTPGWSCHQNCASVARSGEQMSQCTTCIRTSGVNAWVRARERSVEVHAELAVNH